MRIESVKEKLKDVLSKTEKITGKNLTLPVLSCVLLTAKGNHLTVKATNLDLGIEISIPVKVQKEGTLAVPASVFNNFISSLPSEGPIILEENNQNLVISSSKGKTVIKTVPYDDFPTIPVVKDGNSVTLPSKDLVNGLKSVWYSSSVSTIKPELSSVCVYQEDDSLVFVATDSFRLAEKKVKVKKGSEFEKILIPYKNIPEIVRVIENSKEVSICFNKNQISFSYDSVYLVSRVIDGIFPDYKQIIPKDKKTDVIVIKNDLIDVLKIANIFTDQFNQVSVKVQPSKKTFEVQTKNSNVGESSNLITATLSGEEINMNFNYKYISDCFQSIDSDTINLRFNGLNKPVVIQGVSDRSFTYLVMPMNN